MVEIYQIGRHLRKTYLLLLKNIYMYILDMDILMTINHLHYFRYLIAMSCLMVLQINVSRSNKNKMFKQLAFLICIFLRHTRKQKRIESCLLT